MNRKDRILVVDDDSMNLARTRIILSKEYDGNCQHALRNRGAFL